MDERRAAWLMLGAALGLLLAALAGEPSSPRPGTALPPKSGAARLLWGAPLDLNREEAASLEALPGIGPARARAIILARPFCRVSELDRVPGIGPLTLLRLRGRVAVGARLAACSERD